MWSRYNKKVMEFFGNAESYAYRIYDEKYDSDNSCYRITERPKKFDYIKPILTARGNWDKVYENPDVNLGDFKMPLDIFAIKMGDYRVYNAFLNVYYAVMRYYKYHAKYNLRDIELENALAEWNLTIKQNNNILQNIIAKLTKAKVM